MEPTEFILLSERPVRAEWREVVRDVGGEAKAFLRLALSGSSFARGAMEPLVLIGDMTSRFAVITPDGRTLMAYFDTSIPSAELITVAYGDGSVDYFEIDVEARPISPLQPFD